MPPWQSERALYGRPLGCDVVQESEVYGLLTMQLAFTVLIAAQIVMLASASGVLAKKTTANVQEMWLHGSAEMNGCFGFLSASYQYTYFQTLSTRLT